MPLEIAVFFSGEDKPHIERVQVNEKTNTFFIDTENEPEKIILDPNLWVLMDVDFKKK